MKEQDTPQATIDVVRSGDNDVVSLIRHAVDSNVPVEALERLVALKERVDDRKAAHDFAAALSAFQDECPMIPKSTSVKFTTKSGHRVSYDYAKLADIESTIRPTLREHGFSYTWDSRTDGQQVTVVCTLQHVSGQQRAATFSCPAGSSAGMSDQQKFAAALSFGRRQSLVQVLGLTTCDPDNDGASDETITDKQAADLRALMGEVGADETRFLKYIRAKSVDEIRSCDYAAAVTALEAKRRGA